MAISAKLKNLLKEWDSVKNQIAPLKAQLDPLVAQERAIRKQIVDSFEQKVEGSKNTVGLANGYTLKMNYKLKREIDEPVLKNLHAELAAAAVPVDMLIKYKPQLETSVYRALNDQQRAVVDKALVIKEDSHTVEIVAPKNG